MNTTPPKTLLEALKLNELPVEEQEELILELNELIYNGTMLRMIDSMDDELADRFNEFLDTDPSNEEMQEFLEKYVPNADQAAIDTIESLTSDILAATGESQD